VDLPDGVTPEILALQRGEDVRLPDGRRVHLIRPHAPLSGASGPWGVMVDPEDDVPTSIRLSPDYSAPSPLWPSSDATDALVPKELLGRLIRWQRDFDSNFRWDTGWQSEEAKARWAAQAADLEADLRVALEGRAELTVDLWPL
jgi:hypothetical protein